MAQDFAAGVSRVAGMLAQPSVRWNLLVTLALLAVFRLGSAIPLPGLDLRGYEALRASGPAAVGRLSIFALGTIPILSALMLLEAFRLAACGLRVWRPPPPGERWRLPWLRPVALVLAAFQGLGIAQALEAVPRMVVAPGWEVRIGIVATLVAATALVCWLADQIARHGVFNGLWLLMGTAFLIGLPGSVLNGLELERQGALTPSQLVFVVLALVAAIAAVVVLVILERTAAALTAAAHNEIASVNQLVGPWPMFIGAWLTTLLLGLAYAQPFSTDWEANAALAPGRAFHGTVFAVVTGALVWLHVASGNHGRRVPRSARILGLLIGALQIAICIGLDVMSARLALAFWLEGPWLIVMASMFVPAAQAGARAILADRT